MRKKKVKKLLGWRAPESMVKCSGMSRQEFERAAARLKEELLSVCFPSNCRWRMAMRARNLSRPRRKISGHHRI